VDRINALCLIAFLLVGCLICPAFAEFSIREIEAALARQVCTGIPGVPCYSVNDVLGLVQAGKDFIGLSKLEDLAFSILDPVINKVLGPIQAVFPAPPSFPALDLGLPEFSGMLNDDT
jgi:hypothetical protein